MKDLSGPRADAAGEHGFKANLTGADLADLVQMECLARTTQVVRVISGDDVGYLYFKAGSIVHAVSSSAFGEAAAYEILGWDRGSFEPCNAGWPSAATITKPWQALLMSAANARDESRRSTVVDFPRERTQGSSMSQKSPPGPTSHGPATIPSARAPSTTPPSQAASVSPPVSGTPASTRGIDRAVRLEADGKVLSTRGDAEELAAMTAYTMRVAALIGERLGMEDLRAVECVTAATRRLFYVERNGNVIGLEAPISADLQALREKIGV